MSLLYDGLLPASFRGVPFAVRQSSTQFSRRQAVHQYPGRDTPWVEDLGRGARRIRFQGFLVTGDTVYAGGPVAIQRALLIAVAEKKGPGTLTHPTLGVLNASVEGLSVSEDTGAGGYSDIEFSFIESGKQSFPSLFSLAGAQIGGVSLLTVATVLNDAVAVIKTALKSNASIPAATKPWAAQVQTLATDATALNRLAAGLPGNLGRYAQGGNVGFAGQGGSPYAADTTIAQLVADASAQRSAVTAAATAFAAAVEPAAITMTASTAVNALLAACADPSDGLRLMTKLAAFSAGSDPVSGAVGDLFRRLGVVALAQASSLYQPSSYDDAFAKLAAVTAAIETEATKAADARLDDTFNALENLRVAVVQDLRARGGALTRVRRFNVGGSLPDCVLAQRFYRDPTRADELLTQVPFTPHPLFMPASFDALAA